MTFAVDKDKLPISCSHQINRLVCPHWIKDQRMILLTQIVTIFIDQRELILTISPADLSFITPI